MDDTRLQIGDSNNLESRVATAMKIMRELKQSQFIGSDSIRFYKRDSGNVYDWGGVPPQSPQSFGNSTKVLRVTATALTQNVLFADLIFEQRINSPTAARHTIFDYIDEIYANTIYFDSFAYADAQMPGQEHICSWTVVLDGGNPTGGGRPLNNQYLKVYVVANDDVQIAVTELN